MKALLRIKIIDLTAIQVWARNEVLLQPLSAVAVVVKNIEIEENSQVI